MGPSSHGTGVLMRGGRGTRGVCVHREEATWGRGETRPAGILESRPPDLWEVTVLVVCPCCWQPEQTETPALLQKPPNCGSLRPGPGWRPRPVLRPGTLFCLLYASSFYFFLSIKGSADPRARGPTLESRKSLGLLTRNLNF